MTVNEFYQVCVDIMKALASYTNTTYEEINIIVFLIIQPLMILVLLFLYIRSRRKLKV